MLCNLPRAFLRRGRANTIRCLSQIWIPGGSQDGQNSKLLSLITSRIRFDGPMTVAQYMQEILTNPQEGYYMKKDVFGVSGDFTTSPEVSQMFGECIGIWIFNEWMKMGSPKPLQLVELGPGRGTLMCDILRTLSRLSPNCSSFLSVHLVEISPFLTKIQEASLCGLEIASTNRSKFGTGIQWYKNLDDVPKGFSFFIANEFFDALPVHKFVRIKDEKNKKPFWREVLIDIDPEDPDKLRWIRSRHETPASKIVQDEIYFSNHENLEVSLKSGLIIKELSERIVENGGAALICDYGHEDCPEKGDSFRAFKNNKQHDPLIDPGSADLTSDVNFAHLRRSCPEDTLTYGPATQTNFLLQLGIELRLQKLLKINAKISEELRTGFLKLVDPKQMGECFKFFAIFPKTMQDIHETDPPEGFKKI